MQMRFLNWIMIVSKNCYLNLKSKLLLPRKLNLIIKKYLSYMGVKMKQKSKLPVLLKNWDSKQLFFMSKLAVARQLLRKLRVTRMLDLQSFLYTPDDVGALAAEQQDLKNRARQNVVFEHGYLMAKIGRDRVAPLVKGNIELPNDISGVVYVSNENWQVDLAKELSSAVTTLTLTSCSNS